MELLPREYIGYFHEDGIRIFTYQSENYNAIFYLKDDESYVMLGGYGHYGNVYTHFLSVDMEKSLKEKWLRSVIGGCLEVFPYCWSTMFKDRTYEDEADLFACKRSSTIRISGT